MYTVCMSVCGDLCACSDMHTLHNLYVLQLQEKVDEVCVFEKYKTITLLFYIISNINTDLIKYP